MSIHRFIRRFFGRVEATPDVPPTPDELVDGKAFVIKHYPMTHPVYCNAGDELAASVYEDGQRVGAEIRELITQPLCIDTISTIRFNDALGYKHAIGALFGERKA